MTNRNYRPFRASETASRGALSAPAAHAACIQDSQFTNRDRSCCRSSRMCRKLCEDNAPAPRRLLPRHFSFDWCACHPAGTLNTGSDVACASASTEKSSSSRARRGPLPISPLRRILSFRGCQITVWPQFRLRPSAWQNVAESALRKNFTFSGTIALVERFSCSPQLFYSIGTRCFQRTS